MTELKPKATRESFGETLLTLGESNPNIVVLDADLSASTKSGLFAKRFPDRFFQMGIAEANMIGTGAGLALTGKIPFICSFGCFVTGRYETIRVSVGYMETNVKIVGTHAGIGIGEDGYTQMGLEDINVLRALPNMAILQPSDHSTTVAAVKFATAHDGPVYLRLTRQKLPPLHASENVFQFGKGIVLKEGANVALLASGATVAEIAKAADMVGGLRPWVVDFPTVKPIDRELIKNISQKCQRIVTVEDHNIIGGLGSAVAEVLAEEGYSGKLLRIGIEGYAESGTPEDLYDKYGLSAPRIAERVKAFAG